MKKHLNEKQVDEYMAQNKNRVKAVLMQRRSKFNPMRYFKGSIYYVVIENDIYTDMFDNANKKFNAEEDDIKRTN